MRAPVISLVMMLVVSACAADEGASASSAPSGTGIDAATVAADPQPTSTSATPGSTDEPPAASAAPQYDVFLAAVAEAAEGTRFADTALEEPELVAASGLLLCERLEAGWTQDEVVLEYLAELSDGEATGADDDQLTLAGALLGAAIGALCPQMASE